MLTVRFIILFWGSTRDQPGLADLDTFYAALSHYAAYVYNVVFELFGSIFCEGEVTCLAGRG
jgi:hypothetical protein